MHWQLAAQPIPGAAVTAPSSPFAAIAQSISLDLVSQKQAEGPRPPTRRRINLDGLWERAVQAELADAHRLPLPSALPPLQYVPSRVPQNYGVEPDLQRYHGPVWYRRSLLRPPNAQYVDLHLESVDYLADVLLDGVHVASHEGYFTPIRVDVSEVLRAESELVVRVQDPLDTITRSGMPFFPHRSSIKGVLNVHDSRRYFSLTGEDDAASQFRPTGGIVGSTWLAVTGPIRLDAVFLTPLDVSGGLQLALCVTNRTEEALRAAIRVDLVDPHGNALSPTAFEVECRPGASRLDVTTQVPDPQLWWDASLSALGAANLYTAYVNVIDSEGVSDSRVETFGLRHLAFPTEPLFHYELNHHDVRLRATNYIPVEHWADLGADFYERDFRLMKQANVHSAGVHGHVQSRRCYEAADREGISIFQDFPLQWNYASGTAIDPDFLPTARQTAADMVYLLWNHPSIVYWCAHNEPPHYLLNTAMASIPHDGRAPFTFQDALEGTATPPFPVTAQELGPQLDFGNFFLDEALVEVLRTVDPFRYVHRDSGQGIDMHDYTGTLSGGSILDIGSQYTAPFVSEYGDFVIDTSMVKHVSASEPWPPTEERFADLCRGGLKEVTAGMVGPMNNFRNLAEATEAMERRAAFAAKYLTEYFRIHGDRYSGHRWHFFVNHWGHAGAGLLDVDRVPTLAYHAFALANRSQLACTTLPACVLTDYDVTFPIHLVNDSPHAWDAHVTWTIERLPRVDVIRSDRLQTNYDEGSALAVYQQGHAGTYVLSSQDEGEVVQSGEVQQNVAASDSIKAHEVTVGLAAPGAYRLKLAWGDETNDFTVLLPEPGWEPRIGLQNLAWSASED